MSNELKKLIVDDTIYLTKYTKKYEQRKPHQHQNDNEVRAFIPGVIRDIFVQEGDSVKKGDKLLVLEAMKMKNRIFAHKSGIVKKIYVTSNQTVAKNDLLIEFQS